MAWAALWNPPHRHVHPNLFMRDPLFGKGVLPGEAPEMRPPWVRGERNPWTGVLRRARQEIGDSGTQGKWRLE